MTEFKVGDRVMTYDKRKGVVIDVRPDVWVQVKFSRFDSDVFSPTSLELQKESKLRKIENQIRRNIFQKIKEVV